MIISELYNIQLSTSEDNVDINSNDTIITVKVVDFNKEVVINKEINITCNLGCFIESSIMTNKIYDNNNNIKGFKATTNSEGIITVNYKPLNFGLETIFAEHKNLQFEVKGFLSRNIKTGVDVYYNNEIVVLTIHGIQIGNGGTVCTLPSEFAPIYNVDTVAFSGDRHIIVSTSGAVACKNRNGTGTGEGWECITWIKNE